MISNYVRLAGKNEHWKKNQRIVILIYEQAI